MVTVRQHERAGQIRDFSLFQHFVKPMSAGVSVTAVLDCCHSGSVLDLPYSFEPTPGGQIRMQKNFDSLSNLAFLYILAGGFLPGGFGNVVDHLSDTLGQPVDEFYGTGAAEMENTDLMDDSAVQQASDYIPSSMGDYDSGEGEHQLDPNDTDFGMTETNADHTVDDPCLASGVSDGIGSHDLAQLPPLSYEDHQNYGDFGDVSVPNDADYQYDCECGEGLIDTINNLLDEEQ